MNFIIESHEIRDLVKEVVRETLATIDWPVHRLTLTEAEGAEALGVGRHVLRDLRLRGKIRARRIGKKIVYTRTDLLEALENSG
jgi:Helix-turn-helix domain